MYWMTRQPGHGGVCARSAVGGRATLYFGAVPVLVTGVAGPLGPPARHALDADDVATGVYLAALLRITDPPPSLQPESCA